MPPYKIVFLDIDGVLNSRKYLKKIGDLFDIPENQMDYEAIQRLNKITDSTGAKIVVSSSWRIEFDGQLDLLKNCFANYGITGDIIDMTPILANVLRNRRGKEIQRWIDHNRHLIDKFVILDDDGDTGKLIKYQIKTSFENGLLDEHINKAIEFLK